MQYDYTYDSTDRLISSTITDTANHQRKAMFEYDFDLNNNMTKRTVKTPYGANTTNYAYVKDNVHGVATFENGIHRLRYYDIFERLQRNIIDTEHQIETDYTYLASNESGYTTKLVEKEENGVFSYKYEYDNLGNISKIYTKSGDNWVASEEYTYDHLNQLTGVKYLDRDERV